MIHQCLRLFTSDAFFLLLSNLTGLRLHHLAPEDSDQEDEEEGGKEKVIRVIGAVNEISQYIRRRPFADLGISTNELFKGVQPTVSRRILPLGPG